MGRHRLPLEGGGRNVIGLDRPTQNHPHIRGRTKPLTFRVGVPCDRMTASQITPT
jgi:hypothetical protein